MVDKASDFVFFYPSLDEGFCSEVQQLRPHVTDAENWFATAGVASDN